jgi:alpha-L-fucosidase
LEETKMPVSQYEKFAGQFNPVKFDAKEWVRLAKEAGMKYIVITRSTTTVSESSDQGKPIGA